MAGSPENAFIVTVQPWTLTARLYPHARWRLSSPSVTSTVSLAPVGFEEKLVATAAIGIVLALVGSTLMVYSDEKRGEAVTDGAVVQDQGLKV